MTIKVAKNATTQKGKKRMPDEILKAYFRATMWFRDMEFSDPYHKEWGEYANAMDAVLSTVFSVVRCKDCKHSNTGNWCDAHAEHYPDDDWFCADGEKKNG